MIINVRRKHLGVVVMGVKLGVKSCREEDQSRLVLGRTAIIKGCQCEVLEFSPLDCGITDWNSGRLIRTKVRHRQEKGIL